jgi:hypothetical protein
MECLCSHKRLCFHICKAQFIVKFFLSSFLLSASPLRCHIHYSRRAPLLLNFVEKIFAMEIALVPGIAYDVARAVILMEVIKMWASLSIRRVPSICSGYI